jgi:GTP-binding protein
VPGLIEGAAQGRGLGHEFLRHDERARVLCILLDCSDAAPAAPAHQLEVLEGELTAHLASLSARPRVVVGSKADVRGASVDDSACELVVSAATGEGIAALVSRLAVLVQAARSEEEAAPRAPRLHVPAVEEVEVRRVEPGRFEVLGRAAARAVALSDLTDPGALDEVHRRLARLGVDRALARAGAHEGDVVAIGDVELEWAAEGSDLGA